MNDADMRLQRTAWGHSRRRGDVCLFPNKLDEVDSISAFVSVDAQVREGLAGVGSTMGAMLAVFADA